LQTIFKHHAVAAAWASANEAGGDHAPDHAPDEPTWPIRRDILDHRLRSSEPLERWKREQEELERARQQETAARERRYAEDLRQRQQAAEMTPEFLHNLLVDLVVELRRERHDEIESAVGSLRTLTASWFREIIRDKVGEREKADEIRKELREEIYRAVGELRDEIVMKRTTISPDGAVERDVIDLPRGWWKRHVA
jgi:hypothetical protein